VQSNDTREKRARRVIVAFAAIVMGAIAAFTVTMSMTTSYPSAPEPPTVARPSVEGGQAVRPGTTVQPKTTATTATATTATTATTTATTAASEGAETAGRSARGGVLVDDGTPRRSPGNGGMLAKDDIRAGVAAVKEKVKDCYQRGLQIDPELGGTVKVAFTLEGNDEGKGVVTKGEIADSDMNSPFFEACVLKEVASAEFKAPGGDGVVNVTYPFHFANDPDAGP
jgi:hypothetical protein